MRADWLSPQTFKRRSGDPAAHQEGEGLRSVTWADLGLRPRSRLTIRSCEDLTRSFKDAQSRRYKCLLGGRATDASACQRLVSRPGIRDGFHDLHVTA